MPVDELLRSAFDVHDDSWDLEVAPALAHVHEKAHHRAVVRRRVAAGALAAVLVPTALVVGVTESAQDAPAASSPASPSPSPGQPPASASEQPLDGWWRSGPITESDVRRTLEDAGLGRWGTPVLAHLPERPFQALMRIRDRRVHLYLVGPDGVRLHYDGQGSNVVGDRLLISDIWSRVASSYAWSTEVDDAGDDRTTVLRLELTATTEQDRNGVPGEVWQRVLYTSEKFVGAGKGLDGQTQ